MTRSLNQQRSLSDKKAASTPKGGKGNVAASPQQVIQRAQAMPHTLSAADVKVLQRSVGNRETTRLLQPILQAKLQLGPAGDKYEQEADRVADQVVRASRLSTPPVQRESATEEELQMKPLAAPQVTPLQRKTFQKRTVQPKETYAPESGAVETSLSAGSMTSQPKVGSLSKHTLQRTAFNNQANAYYSQVLAGQKITENNSVFTATAFDTRGGGHSSVYIESLSSEGERQPQDMKIHLTYDKTSETTHINLQPGFTPRKEPKRRSWVKSSADAERAIARAEEIASEPQKKKKYRFLGGSLTKGGMNCAKFAERILKAGGIKASSGLIFKTPSQLATGKNEGHENTLEQDTENYRNTRKEELERLRNIYKIPQTYGIKQQPQVEKVKTNQEETEWLSNTIGKDFDLAKDLPATWSNREGRRQQETLTLPANSSIFVMEEGLKTGEVVIECMQPRGYFIVNLSLLFDAAPKN